MMRMGKNDLLGGGRRVDTHTTDEGLEPRDLPHYASGGGNTLRAISKRMM